MLRQRVIVFLFASALVLGVFVTGASRPVASAVRTLFLPVVRSMSQTTQSVTSAFGLRWPDWQAAASLQALQIRYAGLRVDEARLQALEQENTLLRTQAHFLNQSGFDSVGAAVIHRDVRQGRALLLIDRGADDQLEVGQAVVAAGGVLVGKISAVAERVASVELLTDPLSRIAAASGTSTQLVGVIEGRGNGTAVLNYIPAAYHLERDQLIVSAGTEDKIPGQLAIGAVNAVEGKATEPFQQASLEPLVSVDRLSLVSVLRPSALRRL